MNLFIPNLQFTKNVYLSLNLYGNSNALIVFGFARRVEWIIVIGVLKKNLIL